MGVLRSSPICLKPGRHFTSSGWYPGLPGVEGGWLNYGIIRPLTRPPGGVDCRAGDLQEAD